jgi:NAD(P)-dependent dehydrogenase (short-subunit alcohol dehydrogenase family)
MPILDGRTALITGGSSGIGLETARQLAVAGVGTILLNGRGTERGERACKAVVKEFPKIEVAFLAADASTVEGASRLAERCRTLMPKGLDILVNSAGGDFMPTLFHKTAPEDIERVVGHWLFRVLHVCRAVIPLMREGGAIVSVASDAAKQPTVGETVIGAALAGVTMFTRAFAMEAKRNGIRVNAVTPSLVEDTGTAGRILRDDFSAKLFTKAKSLAHLGVPAASDIAAMIVFLAGPQARHVTGQIVSVNGGISA